MIPQELARKVRLIEISTTKAANDILAGAYESVFKGRGIEFDEVREYTPGDEVRSIDWNVTARMGHPFIKRFVEERELTIMLLVDLSASGAFGSGAKSKNETAAELSALLAFSAIKNSDKVGLIAFTDRIELHVPARKGRSHVLRLVRDILNLKPLGSKTDIGAALTYLSRTAQKRCVVFLISDFLCGGYEKQLRIAAERHDLIASLIIDPREMSVPDCGLLLLQDAESGERVLLDTSNADEREAFARLAEERRLKLRRVFGREGVDHLEITAGGDYVKELVRFFKARRRRLAA